MFKRILVPLDGSKLAEGVLPYAHDMARAIGCDVELLRVFDPAPVAMAGPAHGRSPEKIDASFRDESLDYLNSIRMSMADIASRVSCGAVAGHPASCIVAEADKTTGTLVAMSTHGRSGVSRWLLGSVTDKVLHAAASPMLIVRSSDGGKAPAEAPLKAVIVPLDGSTLAEQVLPYLTPLVKPLGLAVTLVRVIPPVGIPSGYTDYPMGYGRNMSVWEEETPRRAADYLRGVGDKLRADGLAFVQECVLWGNPAAAIVDLAKATPNNLVAMTTHGRSGLGRWVLGSVADRMVRHSGDPVLIVRAVEHYPDNT